MPIVMAAVPNIGGALCESSVIPFFVPRRKVWLTPAAGVPCSNAANIGERKTSTQSEFCTGQNSVRGKSLRRCIYSVPAQETAKHRSKFGWPPMSDVAAVTKPIRKTRWNLLGCPTKLVNQSQALVGRRSPYCEDRWRRYCYLTIFFWLSIHVFVAKIQPDKVVRWCQDGKFLAIVCVLYFHQTCILNSYEGHTMCGSMAEIKSATADIRRGIKKKE